MYKIIVRAESNHEVLRRETLSWDPGPRFNLYVHQPLDPSLPSWQGFDEYASVPNPTQVQISCRLIEAFEELRLYELAAGLEHYLRDSEAQQREERRQRIAEVIMAKNRFLEQFMRQQLEAAEKRGMPSSSIPESSRLDPASVMQQLLEEKKKLQKTKEISRQERASKLLTGIEGRWHDGRIVTDKTVT